MSSVEEIVHLAACEHCISTRQGFAVVSQNFGLVCWVRIGISKERVADEDSPTLNEQLIIVYVLSGILSLGPAVLCRQIYKKLL